VASLDAKETARSADRGNVESLGDHKYRIEEKLSEGSFGVVYNGVKLLGGSRLPVVIKFVRSVRQLTGSRRLTAKLGTKDMQNPSATRRVPHLPNDH
jgi:hypothetical protein